MQIENIIELVTIKLIGKELSINLMKLVKALQSI